DQSSGFVVAENGTISSSAVNTLLAAIAASLDVCGSRSSETRRGSSTQEMVLSRTEPLTDSGHVGSVGPDARMRRASQVTLSGAIASQVTWLSTTVWPI